MYNIEIKKEASWNTGQAEVGDELGLVNRENSLDRLNFDDQAARNEYVQPVSAVQTHILVLEWHIHLPLKGDPFEGQFPAEALLIGALQETRAQARMDFHCAPDD
jgi:hypothetical protein